MQFFRQEDELTVIHIGHALKKSWDLLLILTVIACVLLLQVSVSERQQIIFPLSLIFLWGCCRKFDLRFPKVLFAVVLAAWSLTLAHFSLKLPSDIPLEQSPFGYLNSVAASQAGFDPDQFFLRFNQIAMTYHLPRLRIRGEDSRPQLKLSQHFVHGYRGLFEIDAENKRLHVKFETPKQRAGHQTDQLLRSFKIPSHAANRVEHPVFHVPLYLSQEAGQLNMQALPEDLTLHFLTWFAEGLRGSSVLADDSLFERERRRNAFYVAANYLGPWISNSPRGLATYLLGQVDLQEAVFGSEFEAGAVSCALDDFKNASGMVQRKYEPEMHAAILNNAAVSMVLGSDLSDPIEQNKVSRWLWLASEARTSTGQVPVSARLALINFQILRREGLLP